MKNFGVRNDEVRKKTAYEIVKNLKIRAETLCDVLLGAFFYGFMANAVLPQFGIRIVHKKVGSLTNILYLYR